MKLIRIALISSILVLASCQEPESLSNEPQKEFNYNLKCLTNNDAILINEKVYSASRALAAASVRYKKHNSDKEYSYITNAICLINPIPQKAL